MSQHVGTSPEANIERKKEEIPSSSATTVVELRNFYANYARNAFAMVINEFPVKIKELDSLRKEFNWKLILSLKSNTEWIDTFVHKLSAQTKPNTTNEFGQQQFCCMSSSKKPLLLEYHQNNDKPETTSTTPTTTMSSMIDTNSVVDAMIERLKPYVLELNCVALQLNFAIQLLTPKMQEGNNFGVEVQDKAQEDVISVWNDNTAFFESLKSYYYKRCSTLRTMVQYPHVRDYQCSLTELDRSFVYILCRGVEDLYNHYTAIHEVVIKDIDKLLNPRDDDDDDDCGSGSSGSGSDKQ